MASDQSQPSSCLVIIANRLSIHDSDEPLFAAFLQKSAAALVAPACLGGRSEAAVFATASAGAYSRGSGDYGLLLNWNETYENDTAADVHLRRIGPPVATAGIVHLGLPAVVAANRRVASPPDVWMLGQALRDAHVLRAAFGNSDAGESVSRVGAGLLSDAHGIIPVGDIGPRTLKVDSRSARGVTTDLDGFRADVLGALRSGAVVEVEYGDLDRIEADRGEYTNAAYRIARKRAVARLFSWVRSIRSDVPNVPILVLALVPPLSDSGTWNSLGLLIASGDAYGHSLLASNTTRTPGIVSTVDIAPTILDAVSVTKPRQMLGYAIREASAYSQPLDRLKRWDLIVRLNEELQFPVLLGLGLLAGAGALVATWYLVGAPNSHAWGRAAVLALAVVAWIPVILLIPLDRPQWFAIVAPGVLVSLGAAAASGERGRFLPMLIPAGCMLAGVAASAFGLADLVKTSALSSYQLHGLRFYGIGNEYMGCVIGAASAVPLWMAGRRQITLPPEVLAVWFVFWALIIALPAFGANLGGAVAATVSFSLVFRALTGKRVTSASAAVALGTGVAAAIALAIIDALASGSHPTHMGMAAHSVLHGNGRDVLAAIQRKAFMNIGLWGRSETRIAALIFAAVFATWLRYRSALKAASKLPPVVTQGLIGLFYGALTALLFNDSGAVSIAFIVIYVVGWYLWDLVTLKTGGAVQLRMPHASPRS